MTAAAIYARVSSARQAKDQTIGSQLSALRDHAATSRLDVPEEWVFADEGHSGATLVRPALEALRDLAAQGCLDVVLVYSPDRLARKFAYQALLIEELARCGARVEFVKGPRGDSPEDQLLIQFQGMFAEYEKAQLMERYRRGKAWRAKSGSVNVLVRRPVRLPVRPQDPRVRGPLRGRPARGRPGRGDVPPLRRRRRRHRRPAPLAHGQGVATRTGKERWDRSVIWGMLRNPAYAGTAVFGKTQAVHEPAGLNRTARLAGRTVPRQVRTQDRPREEWTGIPVPALVDEETFDRVQQRLADNKRFASRNTKVPSLLQGIAACASCGYGYYRTTTTTTAGNKIYYYRCLGSDDYRYQGGRVCQNKPVRADYADQVVWDHVTALLADPALIRAEIGKRLERARTSDPVTRKRGQLEQALAKTSTSIAAMITAFSEQLLTIDELRARMPALRARETGLKDQIAALDAQAADRDAYLRLAGDLEGFLARLRGSSATATVEDRQRVLRAVVQDVLVGPEKITIRHRIPVREPASGGGHHDTTDTEGDMRDSSLLRWGRAFAAARQYCPLGAGRPFRPEMAAGDGHGMAAGEAQAARAGQLQNRPLCGRFRPDGVRGTAPCRDAARGGDSRARSYGAAAGTGEDQGGPHRRGLHVPRLRYPPDAETGNTEVLRLHQAVPQGHPGHQGQGEGQDVQVNPPHGPRRADHQLEPVTGGVGELLPVRGVQGNVQRGRLPCVGPADALDTGQVRGQAPARDERTPPSLL